MNFELLTSTLLDSQLIRLVGKSDTIFAGKIRNLYYDIECYEKVKDKAVSLIDPCDDTLTIFIKD